METKQPNSEFATGPIYIYNTLLFLPSFSLPFQPLSTLFHFYFCLHSVSHFSTPVDVPPVNSSSESLGQKFQLHSLPAKGRPWKLHAISSQHCQPDSPCINVFTPLSRPSWASSSSSPNSTAASWSSSWSTWSHLSLNHPPYVSSCPYPSVPEQSLPLIPNPTHSLRVSIPCLRVS